MGIADFSRRIRLGDVELAYRITGRGKPLILVHGLACGQRMWFHQRRKLSDRHTVITYDQRGHGQSDAPDDARRYSGAHLARDLAGIVDALGYDKIAVVGSQGEAEARQLFLQRRGVDFVALGLAGSGEVGWSPSLRPERSRSR